MLNNNLVLMCGLPASGKSTLVNEYKDRGYTILSCDTKTMSNAIDTISVDTIFQLLEKTNSELKVLIDNTNTVANTRKVFIDYAKSKYLSIGLHHMKTSKDDCLINSLHRMYKRYGKIFLSSSDVPKNLPGASNNFVISAIFAMFKNFDKVTKDEGFDSIENTKFVRDENWGYTNKALFIDLDGTVRESIGEQPYPLKKEDIKILPNRIKILKWYKDNGYMIIAVTNQSGISKGLLTDNKVVELIEHTNDGLNGLIDDYTYCPHLPPRQICYCRKPQSGMGVVMMHKHKLDITNCIMVGDATSDKTFGTRLGMKFYHADNFFTFEK